MENLLKLVNGNGQIEYSNLKRFISEISLQEFTDQAPYPFLIGKDFYEGELKPKLGGSLSNTSTLKFRSVDLEFLKEKRIKQIIDDFDEELEPERINLIRERVEKNWEQKKKIIKKEKEEIQQYIYFLKEKIVTGSEKKNIVTIGRNGTNDIVISNSVISGRHAQIFILEGMYFIMDMGSTNGTKVNNVKVMPSAKVQIPLNATIDFGRISFIFAHPLQVYRYIKKEILGY